MLYCFLFTHFLTIKIIHFASPVFFFLLFLLLLLFFSFFFLDNTICCLCVLLFLFTYFLGFLSIFWFVFVSSPLFFKLFFLLFMFLFFYITYYPYSVSMLNVISIHLTLKRNRDNREYIYIYIKEKTNDKKII